jgi:hypothetical protein
MQNQLKLFIEEYLPVIAIMLIGLVFTGLLVALGGGLAATIGYTLAGLSLLGFCFCGRLFLKS